MKTLWFCCQFLLKKKKKKFFCQYRIRNHNNCVKLKEPKRRKSKYMHGVYQKSICMVENYG